MLPPILAEPNRAGRAGVDRSRGFAFGLGKPDSEEAEKENWGGMHLTRNQYHRKLRVLVGDSSDWLVNADVSGFCNPCHAGE